MKQDIFQQAEKPNRDPHQIHTQDLELSDSGINLN